MPTPRRWITSSDIPLLPALSLSDPNLRYGPAVGEAVPAARRGPVRALITGRVTGWIAAGAGPVVGRGSLAAGGGRERFARKGCNPTHPPGGPHPPGPPRGGGPAGHRPRRPARPERSRPRTALPPQ